MVATSGRRDGGTMDTLHVDRAVCSREHLDRSGVHLFAGPYVTVGAPRCEVPEGSKQLLGFVALRRRQVERRQAAGTLWPVGDEERAAGNLRSALWRLRRAGINVLVADKWSLALGAEVLVDLHLTEQWATRLIEGRVGEGDLAVPLSVADALNLLPGFYDDWVLMERERSAAAPGTPPPRTIRGRPSAPPPGRPRAPGRSHSRSAAATRPAAPASPPGECDPRHAGQPPTAPRPHHRRGRARCGP